MYADDIHLENISSLPQQDAMPLVSTLIPSAGLFSLNQPRASHLSVESQGRLHEGEIRRVL